MRRLLLILCLAAPAAGLAQRGPGTAPSRGPGWLPRKSYLDAQNVRFTAAEMATTVNRLKEIERIFLEIPELATPEGYYIHPAFYGGGDPQSTGNAIASSFTLTFTMTKGGEGSACVQVFVNDRFGGVTGSPYSDGRGQIYFEAVRGDPIPGTYRVWDRLQEAGRSWAWVWLTAGGASPWQSVTREAMLKAAIENAEGKDSEVLVKLRGARAETGYRRWMAEAAVRKAQWGEVAAALSAAEAAKARKQFEQVERETTEALKAQEGSELEEIDRNLTRLVQQGDRWRARIAAMSPAERNAPAWLDNMDASGDFRFVEPQSEHSYAVVQEAPGFLKARRSRVEVRSIIVRLSTSLTCETPVIHRAIWQTYKKLDWTALARLLEPDPT